MLLVSFNDWPIKSKERKKKVMANTLTDEERKLAPEIISLFNGLPIDKQVEMVWFWQGLLFASLAKSDGKAG